MPPKIDITRSCASLLGSIAPPTSGTHRPTPSGEHREGQAELIAAEGSVGLTDHSIRFRYQASGSARRCRLGSQVAGGLGLHGRPHHR
jgi:hypothetical protein